MGKSPFIALVILFSQGLCAQQTRLNGYPHAPDERLLEGNHWVSAYNIDKRQDFKPLKTREPTAREKEVIEEAKRFFESSSLKALALVDGDDIVWKAYKAPANDDSIFTGYSLGKTVTSMIVGKSICAGKLRLDTTAGSLLPELRGTGYESVTVADMLTMRSGIQDGSYWAKGTSQARETIRQVSAGQARWRDMLKVVNKRQEGLFSGPVKPGEKFEYKEIDPLVIGFMLQEAWGERLNEVINRNVLVAAGFQGPSQLQEGVPGEPYAPTIGRFTLDDWIRFAVFVKQSTKETGCFGDYVREATRQHARTSRTEIDSLYYDGYGYLTWIGSKGFPESFWAWGFGGQKLGMNHKNARILVAFSSLETGNHGVHRLYQQWAQVD